MSELKIEAGKRYIDGDGNVTGVLEPYPDARNPFKCPTTGETYTVNGFVYDSDNPVIEDLMSLHVDPNANHGTEAPKLEGTVNHGKQLKYLADQWTEATGQGMDILASACLDEIQAKIEVMRA
jgi:hypothetical protein